MLVRQKLIPLQSLSRRCVGLGCAQFTWGAAAVLTAVFCIIWPVMTIPAGVFSLGYFYFFVILSMAWGLVRAYFPAIGGFGSVTFASAIILAIALAGLLGRQHRPATPFHNACCMPR